MGVEKHTYKMSNSELMWWIARSTMKPLPAVREDMFSDGLFYINSVNHNTQESMFRRSSLNREWYKDNSAESWAEALEANKKLNEELKNGRK